MTDQTDFDRAEKVFGHDMEVAEKIAAVLPRVLPLRRTPDFAGIDTINMAYHELEAIRAAEHKEWLASLTDEEREDYERSENIRRQFLESGREP